MSQPREFMMYPNPREVTSLPPAMVRPFIFGCLNHQELAKVPDLERVMGLGQLARVLDVADMEPSLLQWLKEQPTAKRYDIAALFLWGFWPKRTPTSDGITALLGGLDSFADDRSARDSIVSALAAAFGNTSDQEQKLRIREKFTALRVRREELQPAVQKSIDWVLADDIAHAQKAPPS